MPLVNVPAVSDRAKENGTQRAECHRQRSDRAKSCLLDIVGQHVREERLGNDAQPVHRTYEVREHDQRPVLLDDRQQAGTYHRPDQDENEHSLLPYREISV